MDIPLWGAAALVLGSLISAAQSADTGVCAIAAKPASFDHQGISLRGTVASLRETTSRKGNAYTTFKLQDPSGCGSLDIFSWGHPSLGNGDHVRVDGTFETEHYEGQYRFYNEVEATTISSVP